ncbi:MAG: aminoacyl-tRNA hydrolase, partial [Planctomycetes bacterium]|nr:aminoacyl-tRNA hydrolase [Planctomycetota bacterium]
MKLVVGLGNPGKKYEETRHNIGFRVVDRIASEFSFPPYRNSWQALAAEKEVDSEKVLLLKPVTFMNLSGEALTWCLDSLEQEPELSDILVVTDDVALPLGRIRIRAGGSCGGHNGLASIEHSLASADYPRLRVGVGPSGEENAVQVDGEELVD